MKTADGRTRQDGEDRTGRRVSTQEALRRLAEKDVAPAYKAPRGNQDLDRGMTDHSVDRLELVVGR
jgi:hypothetical protein